MKLRHNRTIILIVVALLVVLWGLYRTGNQTAPTSSASSRRSPSDRTIVVDQSSLVTVEQLLRMPTTATERPFADDALRVADNEMDLAFAQAVRRTGNQPRATSDTAKLADARLQQALRALAADQAQLTTLTAAATKANVATVESINSRLNVVKAQVALDQDEVDDARQDLRRAGGDPQGRMADMIAEHDAASKSSDSLRVVVTRPVDRDGLIHHVQELRALQGKGATVNAARAQADSLAAVFKQRHDRVDSQAVVRAHQSPPAGTAGDSASLAAIQVRALAEKTKATLDQRVDNQHRLSAIYSDWVGALASEERVALNRVLQDLLAILIIVLVAMLLGRWIDHMLARSAARTQTRHVVAQAGPQIIAVLAILFVVFGPPNNLGTILGLVGAGLTVALRDFIVGFMGWFVLIGKHGIRVGDLVEINDVTGEVVELGMFRTALLETGAWSESGHLTGRRVTFNNSFAIEKHYFNFSTSGRWLLDEVRVVVPDGRDPYPIAEAVQKQIEKETATSAREAEAEWSGARRSGQAEASVAGASVTLRPIAGGVEIKLRYITGVAEREELRAKLYRTAVDTLGVKSVTESSPV